MHLKLNERRWAKRWDRRAGSAARSQTSLARAEALEPRLCLAFVPAPLFTPDGVPHSSDTPPFEPADPPEESDDVVQYSIPPAIVPVDPNNWLPAGPAPIAPGQTPGSMPVSGRISGIAVDPTDANVIYVAAAGGGVWKTVNSGSSWTPLTDSTATLSMGSITISPGNHNVIYAGTGEANNSQDSSYGRGILKSIDGGATWTLLGNSVFDRLSIGRIVVDPTNPNTVYAAAGISRRNGVASGTGIFKSINGGATWTNTTTGISVVDSYCDFTLDPSNPSVLYAAIGNRGISAQAGVYKSIDGGANWNPAGNFPNGASNGRIALALAPSNPSVIYASSANPSSGGLFKMMKSLDGGMTWGDITASVPNYLGSQGWYDTTLAVDPTNPNIVIAGGSTTLLRTTNGGSSWSNINQGANGNGPHVDHHVATFDSLGRLVNGSDGGIWRLDSVSPLSWSDLNGNLQTIQFVGVALHPTDNNNMFGGSQDNGTEQTAGTAQWTTREGGDGGEVAFGTTNPNVVYHIAPVASFGAGSFFRRSDDGGASWTSATSGIVDASLAAFYPPFVVDPNNGLRLVLGTDRVNLTVNGGASWTPISPVLRASSTIDALAFSASDANTIYAAAGGHIFVTTNGGGIWTERSAPLTDHIQDLAVDPSNSQIAYAMRDRFGGGHVFRTNDGGVSWADISGNLPDLPANTIAMEGAGAAATLYLGTDNAVYVSNNLGASWSRYGNGLPNVWVRDLEINTNHVLIAGTYGRGVFTIYTQQAVTTTIHGNVFNDTNANGAKDAGESGLAGRIVYQDQNGNASLDSATTTRTSTDVPRSIPDFPAAAITSVLNVSGTSGDVEHVAITFNITHTFDGDLVAYLISPSGTRVQLFASVGDAGMNFTNTTLDDDAATFIGAGSAPFIGSFFPTGLLSGFSGQPANGTWSLEIKDVGPGDVGTLNSWSMSISTGEPSTKTAANGDYSFANLSPGTYHIGQVRLPGWRQTLPDATFPASGLYTVTLGSGQNLSSVDFGNVIDSTPPVVLSKAFLFEKAPQRLQIQFSEDVGASLSPSDFTITDVATNQNLPFSFSYNGATGVALLGVIGSPLPDGNYRLRVIAAGISDAAGNPMAADSTLDFFVLAADANHDRHVDVTDLGVLATNWQGSGKTFSEGDFNYDGVVDVTDLGILATNWQKSLPSSRVIAAPFTRSLPRATRKNSPAADLLENLDE
jgi:subtilisin-like proprotein convertase family protein